MIRQGDLPGLCYIVVSGVFKVLRRLNTQKLAISQFEEYSKQVLKSEFAFPMIVSPQQQKEIVINVEDDKLYEIAELKRGDSFCMDALISNKTILYSVVSVTSAEVLQLERLHLLKYENQLSIIDECKYNQDA